MSSKLLKLTKIKDASREARVYGQIVRQAGEVKVLMAAQEELAVDVETCQFARRVAANVAEMVNL